MTLAACGQRWVSTRWVSTRWRWPLLLAALMLWAIPIRRPLDLPSWHEFDYAALARNYFQEGAPLFGPRIDWRRDGPGYTEMEFPLIPWLTSLAYRKVGVQIVVGRLVSLLAAGGALLVFGRLARGLLGDEEAALLATGFLAINRVVVFVATALQPEAAMLLFYVAAVYGFWRWLQSGKRRHYLLALVATALAILIKAPAAHLGLLFAALLGNRWGWRAFTRPAVWLFSVLALLPGALWYGYAHHLWQAYGNSMGVSNENHWVGWDVWRSPRFVLGTAAIELIYLAGVGGAVLAWAGLRDSGQEPGARRSARIVLLWWASIALYYLVTIRTVSANWAWYYHVVSAPPLCLACGLGYLRWRRQDVRVRPLAAGAAGALLTAWAVQLFLQHSRMQWPGPVLELAQAPVDLAGTGLLAAACLAVTLFLVVRGRDVETARSAGAYAAAVGCALYCFISGQLIRRDWQEYRQPSQERQSAEQLVGKIPVNALILSSGGTCRDATGHRAASDAPEIFYWLDRKGFSLCIQEQSLARVQAVAERGAQFFVATKKAVDEQPGFARQLRQTYRLSSDTPALWLFDLRAPAEEPGSSGTNE